MMSGLDLKMPDHITEALRTNMSGGKTVAQLLAEASRTVPFMRMAELRRASKQDDDLVVLDVRERDAYERPRPGARLLPRGQLELRVDKELPDRPGADPHLLRVRPISTLAAATLREMGFRAQSRSTAA